MARPVVRADDSPVIWMTFGSIHVHSRPMRFHGSTDSAPVSGPRTTPVPTLKKASSDTGRSTARARPAVPRNCRLTRSGTRPAALPQEMSRCRDSVLPCPLGFRRRMVERVHAGWMPWGPAIRSIAGPTASRRRAVAQGPVCPLSMPRVGVGCGAPGAARVDRPAADSRAVFRSRVGAAGGRAQRSEALRAA